MTRSASGQHQLDLFLSPGEGPSSLVAAVGGPSLPPVARSAHAAHWRFSRPALASRHLKRIRERLDLVRRHFPELDGITIRVGLARARGVLGWGSLDEAQPGIWVRPRRCDLFTIAHELTHLLQARRLVPGGEASCDLYAMARSAALIDCEPSYAGCPPAWVDGNRLVPGAGEVLHRLAREAVAAHPERPRRALAQYRRSLAAVEGAVRVRRAPDRIDEVSEVI